MSKNKKRVVCVVVLWCFLRKPEVFRHSNKNEQDQIYTFLDKISI